MTLRTLVEDLLTLDRQRMAMNEADSAFITLQAEAMVLADEIYLRVRPAEGMFAADSTLIRPIDDRPGTTTWFSRGRDGESTVIRLFDLDRLMEPGALLGFVGAARIQRDLRPFQGGCPWILPVHAIDTCGLAWSMPLMRRGSLRHAPWLRWTARQRLEFLVQLVEGVAVIHRRGAVMGNLKPSNVLIGDDGGPRITDVGGSSNPRDGAERLVWVAPELTQGAPPDPRSDVYALGRLATAIICDLRMDATLAGELDRADLSDIPQKLAGVLADATMQDPRRRFPSAMEMLPRLRSGSGRWVALQLRRAGVGA